MKNLAQGKVWKEGKKEEKWGECNREKSEVQWGNRLKKKKLGGDMEKREEAPNETNSANERKQMWASTKGVKERTSGRK